MKKTVCILLALVMVIGLFAACGSTAASDVASAADSAASTESAAAPADAAAADDAEPADASAEDAEPEEYETPEFEEVAYELPLTEEDVTFTMFTSIAPTAGDIKKADNLVWKELQARTGVKFELTEISTWSYNEQFMLMVAGGDWRDVLVNVRTTYTGGLAAAINEEVVMDLASYSDYFPNYYNLINSDPKVYRDCTLGDGEIGAFYGVFDEPKPLESGMLMRGDWLDALGIEDPETIDEYYDAMTAMYNEYGAQMHLPTNGVLTDQAVMSAYDVTGFFIDAGFFTSFQPYTVQNDEVICGFQQDGFREYMKTINKWYEEKLIDQDFMSSTSSSNYLGDGSDEVAKLLNDKYSTWGDTVSYLVKYTGALDPNFEARPIKLPTLEKGDDVRCGENSTRVDMDYYSISTVCEDPELLCQFFDYNYTEEGYMLQNWGIEGETYVTNPDGSHSYTEMITEHEGYETVLEAQAAYLGGNATVRTMEAYHAMHTDEQMHCYDVWNSNFTGEYSIPGTMTMTTDESEEWGTITGDLITYLNETVAQFIIGTKDPNDDAEWETFQSNLDSLGINRCNEIEQDVYDRWAGLAE